MSIPTSLLERGDVRRRRWPDDLGTHLNLLVANGRCGGCFDAWGLQHGEDDGLARRTSQTCLAHAEVCHRGRYGIDSQVPLARLRWSRPLGEPQEWSQDLRLACGRLETRWAGPAGSYTLAATACPERRDLILLEWTWSGWPEAPALELAPVARHHTEYSGILAAQATVAAAAGAAALAVRLGSAQGHVAVAAAGNLTVVAGDGCVRVQPGAGSGRGLVAIALGPGRRAAALDGLARAAAADGASLQRAAAAWRVRWGDAWVEAGDRQVQSLWLRSLYHLLASYAPDRRCPAPPMGLSGNAWGFHFPQDLSFIQPALLRLGHLDIVRAQVGHYADRVDEMEAITRRIYRKAGAMWAWEFPIDPSPGLLAEGAPNPFQYEIHNAANPARMAAEAARHADNAWAHSTAWPVVEASARFFADCLERGADGRWGIHLAPSMGQDEYGGADAPDNLCALFAAEYTLRAALALATRLGLRAGQGWRRPLEEGLAYPRLETPAGFLRSNAATTFQANRQKHPVQLNPLTFLPLGRIDDHVRSAWRQRRSIVSVERDSQKHGGLRGCFYDGWTLPAFLLAAARLGDAEAVAREWRELLPAQLVDPEGITLYESSGFWQPYYTTSMGLVVQAINACLADDWHGPVRDRGAWPEAWGDGACHGFRFPPGEER